MGQYYIVANIDKKEYMRSNGGVKLMEWSYNRNDLILNLMNKLANEWKGDRVYIVGDYALSSDRIDKEKQPAEKDYDYDILEKLEKELGIYNQKENGYYKTLYSFASDNFKELGVKKLNKEEYKYIYNHKRKEFIDLRHCPLAWLYKEKQKYNVVTIAPISLLLALGNGMGGGDYFGNNNELVGKYIADIENLEITKEPLNIGYKEFRPEFYEWIYIPYTEIDKEIEVDKNRRKIATSILDYINKYGNGQYNLGTTVKNKGNRISTLAISIENNNAQVEKRILKSIIENNNEVEIQNIGKELLKKIDECMFEQVTRSCKFELDAKLENDVSEDQFINEMYKKIVEKLKLDNVKDIKTINKKTEIIFESSEKLDIESNGEDSMDDYIKNSKLIKENSQSQENISKDKLKEEIIKEEEEVL